MKIPFLLHFLQKKLFVRNKYVNHEIMKLVSIQFLCIILASMWLYGCESQAPYSGALHDNNNNAINTDYRVMPCHGLDNLYCTTELSICTMQYLLGDFCRTFVSCSSSGEIIYDNSFYECKKCIESCQKSNPITSFECEAKCQTIKPTSTIEPQNNDVSYAKEITVEQIKLSQLNTLTSDDFKILDQDKIGDNLYKIVVQYAGGYGDSCADRDFVAYYPYNPDTEMLLSSNVRNIHIRQLPTTLPQCEALITRDLIINISKFYKPINHYMFQKLAFQQPTLKPKYH